MDCDRLLTSFVPARILAVVSVHESNILKFFQELSSSTTTTKAGSFLHDFIAAICYGPGYKHSIDD